MVFFPIRGLGDNRNSMNSSSKEIMRSELVFVVILAVLGPLSISLYLPILGLMPEILQTSESKRS